AVHAGTAELAAACVQQPVDDAAVDALGRGHAVVRGGAPGGQVLGHFAQVQRDQQAARDPGNGGRHATSSLAPSCQVPTLPSARRMAATWPSPKSISAMVPSWWARGCSTSVW